jgi:hypothetical protein
MFCQILPSITGVDTCHNGTHHTYQTHIPDYYIHIRNGSVLPIQTQAPKLNVNTVKDIEWMNMDFHILPNPANGIVNTPAHKAVTASASGYVYFDDGISLVQSITRMDLFYMNGATDNTATLTVDCYDQVNNTIVGACPAKTNFTQEYIGDITILMATISKMAGANTAIATLNDLKTTVNLKAPVYDAVKDTLTITVADAVKGMHLNIYDI